MLVAENQRLIAAVAAFAISTSFHLSRFKQTYLQRAVWKQT